MNNILYGMRGHVDLKEKRPSCKTAHLAAVYIAMGLFWSSSSLEARTICCTLPNKSISCGDTLPPECSNLSYKVALPGQVPYLVESPMSKEELDVIQDQEQKRAEKVRILKEQKLRDTALLSTYPSLAEIDLARDRQIAELDSQIADAKRLVFLAKKSLAQSETAHSEIENSLDGSSADLAAIEKAKSHLQTNQSNVDDAIDFVSKLQQRRREVESRFEADRSRLNKILLAP